MPLVELLERRMFLSAAGTGTISGQLLDIPTFMSPPLAPLVGWEVYVDLNHSGHSSPLDPTAVTDAAGDYMFSSLRAGRYRVETVFPPGWWNYMGAVSWSIAMV